MGKIKINSNLFLESQELNKLIKLLDDAGFRRLFKGLTKKFGLLQNVDDLGNNSSFEVVPYNVSSVKIKGDSIAFDSNKKTIYLKDDIIQEVPIDANNTYWFKVAYSVSNLEDGTITIDTQGNVTGVDTKFTEVLRGQPNFPTKIVAYYNNIFSEEYEVLKVINDTQMILQGNFTSGGLTDAQYAVIGTFDYSATIPDENKKIYEYDSCKLTVIVSDTQPVLSANEEFLIAKVTNFSGSIIITDLRNDNLLKLTDIIDNDNYALINRENIFEGIIGNKFQDVTAINAGTSQGFNIILGNVSSSMINLDATGIISNTTYGFWKSLNVPFEEGTILTIRNVSDQIIALRKPTIVNSINTGIIDYAPWLYSDENAQSGMQFNGRFLRKNQIIKIICLNNSYDNVDNIWRSLWVVLYTTEDMYKIWNKVRQIEENLENISTNVYVNGQDGITDTSSADNDENKPAKEGDIWIS